MYHFIINPSSSSNHGISKWSEIKARLIKENISFSTHITSTSNTASDISRTITTIETEKKQVIAILGGDGTLNEVINGAVSFDSHIFAYIPTGSSNDFARSLNLPTKPMDAIEYILHPKKYASLNYGEIETGSTTRRFIVSCGIGYDASVCNRALTSSTKSFFNSIGLGKLTYGVLGIKEVFSYLPDDATIILDDTIVIPVNKMLFTSVHNCGYEGGGFLFCPNADPSDNFLDVCVANNISPGKFFMLLPFALKGKHLNFKGIENYRCKKIEISNPKEKPVHTDGEVLSFSSRIRVACGSEQINFIVG